MMKANNAPINDNKISRKMIMSISFQKYKNKSLKHNKLNKIFDTQVENKNKG